MELRRILPEKFWIETNAMLIQLGQNICRPLKPNCEKCPLRGLCRYDLVMAENEVLKTVENAPPHPTLKHLR